MVFGIGEVKIDIITDKMNYSMGDSIKGKVVLQLNVPKKAKELRLRLWGERTHYSNKGAQRKEYVYDYTLTFDREKEYTNSEYPFEIALPKMPLGQQPTGLLGEIIGAAQAMGAAPTQVKWYLEASLNMPMSLDITKKIQLNIA